MKKLLVIPLIILSANATFAGSSKNEITRILKESGVKGGFVVHVGSDDGSATAALQPNDSYQVHALVTDASQLKDLRKEIRESAGSYGTVAADVLRGNHLPYIDNMVNLLLAEDGVTIDETEILRVLSPLGVAYILNERQVEEPSQTMA